MDGGFDLAAVAHDAGVVHQTVDVGRPKSGNVGHVEVGKGGAKGRSLAQDREPRKSRLKALQTEALEEAVVGDDRTAPLAVVIVEVLGRADRPEAA